METESLRVCASLARLPRCTSMMMTMKFCEDWLVMTKSETKNNSKMTV